MRILATADVDMSSPNTLKRPGMIITSYARRAGVSLSMTILSMWTFGALLVAALMNEGLELDHVIRQNLWSVLGIAALVGLIPESGQNLVFLTSFAKGAIPFSILLTSSIVQDGNGILQMLAHSRRAFVFVRFVRLAIGLLIGGALHLLGR